LRAFEIQSKPLQAFYYPLRALQAPTSLLLSIESIRKPSTIY
jgi:hypothetical protein